MYEKYQDKKALYIDGKAVRGASESSKGEKPVYHLNAMYEGRAIGVGLKRVGEKENEISVLPDYLKQEDITLEAMQKFRAAHWNIEMQHWSLDIQLKEDQQTARKDDAVTNDSILRRFCMVLIKQDTEFSAKPMKRFLMANEHDPNRIEKLLFKNAAQEEVGL